MFLYHQDKWIIGFGYTQKEKAFGKFQQIFHNIWACNAGLTRYLSLSHENYNFDVDFLGVKVDAIIEYYGLHARDYKLFNQSVSFCCAYLKTIAEYETNLSVLLDQSTRLQKLARYLQKYANTQTSSVSMTYTIQVQGSPVTVTKIMGIHAQWRDIDAFGQITQLYHDMVGYLNQFQCTGTVFIYF